jgi:3',5'-cyclic AMP phosphodiesterase CpdA
MPTNILHLSDIHYGRSKKESKNLKKIVDKVVADPQNDANLIILITGDLVHDGRKHQFKAVREILDPLFQKFTVWTIPGNHDYGWRGSFAKARKFKHFKHHFYGIEQIHYPHLTTYDGHLFIGLNSMMDETDGLDGLLADGELGSDQLDDLGGILDQTVFWPRTKKIILHLHHHPFIFPDETLLSRPAENIVHRLKDGKRLMRLISGRVDVVLFGHDHRHLDFSNSSLSDQ